MIEKWTEKCFIPIYKHFYFLVRYLPIQIRTLFSRWIQRLAETCFYITGINIYDKVSFFSEPRSVILGTFFAYCGPLFYGILLPLILLWRQISFRKEWVGLFREAKANTVEMSQLFSRARITING